MQTVAKDRLKQNQRLEINSGRLLVRDHYSSRIIAWGSMVTGEDKDLYSKVTRPQIRYSYKISRFRSWEQ